MTKTLLFSVNSTDAELIASGKRTWIFLRRLIKFPCDELFVFSRADYAGAIIAIAQITEIKDDFVPHLWTENEAVGNPACMSEDEFYNYYKRDLGTVIKLGGIRQVFVPLERIIEVDKGFALGKASLIQYLSKSSPILQLERQKVVA